jgi:hypothetical protein
VCVSEGHSSVRTGIRLLSACSVRDTWIFTVQAWPNDSTTKIAARRELGCTLYGSNFTVRMRTFYSVTSFIAVWIRYFNRGRFYSNILTRQMQQNITDVGIKSCLCGCV